METTEFIIINDYKEEVTVYLTLEVSESFVSDINHVPFIKKRINSFQGAFQLAPQKFVHYKSPKEMIFGGKVSFNSLPMNQTTPSFPHGVNVAEFVVNNHLDYPKTYESAKINNKNGTNALMKFTFNGGGNWTERMTENGQTLSLEATMKKTLNHLGTHCISFDSRTFDPYQTFAHGPLKSEKSVIAKRPASQAGGIVALTYLGSTTEN
ncbi:MAG: hypothetical protein ACJAXX_002704 [Roseivirga sp.]|jgi:hypothetical protein